MIKTPLKPNTTQSQKPEKPGKRQLNTPELLAPAGGLPAFFAALEAGADAVYCGLENFSARAKAKNFAPTDLTIMAGYAINMARRYTLPSTP